MNAPFGHEWATDSTGRQVLIRTAVKAQAFTPPQSYRTEFRCSPTSGRRWQVQIPVTNPAAPPFTPAPQPCYEWRFHPHTGERYQVQVSMQGQPGGLQQAPAVPAPQPLHVQRHGQHQQPLVLDQTRFHDEPTPDVTNLPFYDSSQQQSSSHLHEQSRNATMSRHERLAGIVSLLEGGGSTKNLPKVIEFAKKCPNKWSKQATLGNINLPLYAWGVLEEIEAALSGRSQALQGSVVLGKLRHLKNTLEVCCQNSTSHEFTGYGWTLAKDYASKLNDEIDQGRSSWQDVQLEVKTSTLMSATMENPRPPPKTADPRRVKQDDKKELCTTYNKCTTESKCDYEVANPDKTCQRKHECSWCRLKKNQSWRHQASRCRNKEASGSG